MNLAGDDFPIGIAGRGALLRCASHDVLFVPENGLCIAGSCAGDALDAPECGVADEVVWVRVRETADGRFGPVVSPGGPDTRADRRNSRWDSR